MKVAPDALARIVEAGTRIEDTAANIPLTEAEVVDLTLNRILDTFDSQQA